MSLDNIVASLRNSKTNVRVVSVNENNYLLAKELLYIYTESHLPVILLFYTKSGGHAVTTVAHWIDQKNEKKDTNDANEEGLANVLMHDKFPKNLYTMGQICTDYSVHNDNYGPFNHFHFPVKPEYKKESYPVEGLEFKQCSSLLGEQTNLLKYLIFPMPNYVKSIPEEILADAGLQFSKLFGESNKQNKQYVIRLLLVKENDFKKNLDKNNYISYAKKFYRNKHFPKYIWLIEFSPKNQVHNESRDVDFLFICDASTVGSDVNIITLQIGYSIFHWDMGIELNDIDSIRNSSDNQETFLCDKNEYYKPTCYKD